MKKFLFILSLFILPFFILSQEQEWVKLMQDPEANFYTIQQSFSEFWKTHDANQKGNGYKVFKRWENFVAPRVFPSGKLSELNKRMKTAKMKERMKAKAESNLKAKMDAEAMKSTMNQPVVTDEEILKIFSTGEKVERTPRGAKPAPVQQPVSETKKKKKSKK